MTKMLTLVKRILAWVSHQVNTGITRQNFRIRGVDFNDQDGNNWAFLRQV